MSESTSRNRKSPSASASVSQPSLVVSGVPLPLIQCPKCNLEPVVELISKTPKHYMERFFKCPRYDKVMPLCSFFIWEKQYAHYLVKNGFIDVESAQGKTEARTVCKEEFEPKEEVALSEVKQMVKSLNNEVVLHKHAMKGKMHMLVGWMKKVTILCDVNAIILLLLVLVHLSK